MKKLFLLSFIFLLHLSKAQDIIFIYDGTKINAQVISIENEIVTYKIWNNLTDTIYTIPQKKIIMINYANGNRSIFANNENNMLPFPSYNENELLEYDKLSSSKLRLGNKLLTEKEAFYLLFYEKGNIYSDTWLGANKQKHVGNILFISGLLLSISSNIVIIYDILYKNNIPILLLSFSGHTIGLGMFTVGLIFKIIGESRMNWTLDTYNCKIRLNNQTSLNFMPSPTGLSLQLKF